MCTQLTCDDQSLPQIETTRTGSLLSQSLPPSSCFGGGWVAPPSTPKGHADQLNTEKRNTNQIIKVSMPLLLFFHFCQLHYFSSQQLYFVSFSVKLHLTTQEILCGVLSDLLTFLHPNRVTSSRDVVQDKFDDLQALAYTGCICLAFLLSQTGDCVVASKTSAQRLSGRRFQCRFDELGLSPERAITSGLVRGQ